MTVDLAASLRSAWRTSNIVTVRFIERLPPDVWRLDVPGVPRRTIRGIGAHLHNSRCSWIRTLGREHGLRPPERVDRHNVTQRQLAAALKRSGAGMDALLKLACDSGGAVPPSKGYVWRNLPLDAGHVLTYFVAHEAHHRGQIVIAARQAGQRLPRSLTGRLWWWKPDN